jgi:hypothetical protein
MARRIFYTPSEVAGSLKVNRSTAYQGLISGQLNEPNAGQDWRIAEIAPIKRKRVASEPAEGPAHVPFDARLGEYPFALGGFCASKHV